MAESREAGVAMLVGALALSALFLVTAFGIQSAVDLPPPEPAAPRGGQAVLQAVATMLDNFDATGGGAVAPICSNNLDDEGDGRADANDPGCVGLGTSETNPDCVNGLDDDGDGLLDYPDDPGCASAFDTGEGPQYACSDGLDNEAVGTPGDDGLVDWPADPGCRDRFGTTEAPACNDGVDTDPDTAAGEPDNAVDMADNGCDFPWDASEASPQCSDGIDNDPAFPLDDDLMDYPLDLGCSSAEDNSEAGVTPGATPARCGDGYDNDGDGRTDMADPGCSATSDATEDDEPACDNLRDDDADGRTDFPNDPGCSNAADTDENNFLDCLKGDGDDDGDGYADFPADPGCSSETDTSEGPSFQCSDGTDNELPTPDGFIDYSPTPGLGDPECVDMLDNDEANGAPTPPVATPSPLYTWTNVDAALRELERLLAQQGIHAVFAASCTDPDPFTLQTTLQERGVLVVREYQFPVVACPT